MKLERLTSTGICSPANTAAFVRARALGVTATLDVTLIVVAFIAFHFRSKGGLRGAFTFATNLPSTHQSDN